MAAESELEMTARHVAAGRALVKRQSHLVEDLIRDGRGADIIDRARALLAALEVSQRLHEAHHAMLL